MGYRAEAMTVAGFIQQLAVCYVGRGYWFYVAGVIPEGKEPAKVDAKLVTRYVCDRSKWTRVRRKRSGLSSAQYLRHGRLFVLLATAGEGEFFEHERATFRDARREPVRAFGYSVGYRGGHVSVRIDPTRYRELKAHLLDLAPRLPTDAMTATVQQTLAYEPFAGVRSQAACVLRAVNRARREAGREPVPAGCLPTRRRVVRPFDPPYPEPVGPGDCGSRATGRGADGA